MAGRSMNLDVIVRLRDLLTGPLRRLRGALDGISNIARRIGLVGTAIAAISFMGPIQEAAAFQQQLLDIAGTQNLVGQAAFTAVDNMKKQYEDLGLVIGQLSDTIAKGSGQMIAAGVDPKLVDASIGTIGRAATAANAEFSDMAGVATSMLNTLKLPADQLNSSLAGLVVAGKEGAFELKDMARYFPTLTSQMAKFGVVGREAVNFLGAGLQIARMGTADPAEAANNLKNFLAKILAPATIKNFSDAGVDIEAVMRDAATKGINPIEAVIQKIVKLTGVSGTEIEKLMLKAKANGLEGAEALSAVREQLEQIHGAGALGGLFADMQVMDFLIPMLGNIDEFKRIKDEVAKASGAVIDGDFETQMMGLNRQLITFKEIGTQAGREVGFAFGSWLPMINENLMAALRWLRELDAETGGMVRQALSFAGAGILAAAALGALGIALPVIGAGLSLIAALFSPVGLVFATIAAAGAYLFKNWSTYGPQVFRLWDRLKTGFGNFGRSLLETGRDLVGRYGPMVRDGLVSAWATLSSGFGSFVSSVRTGGAQIMSAGREMVDRYGPMIRDGLLSAWADASAGWEKFQALIEGFRNGLDMKFDLSGLTIDNAKIAAFEALNGALNRIKIGWEALKDFGNGFAPYFQGIGEDLGSTINSVVRIGEAFARVGSALLSIIGIDPGKVSGFFKGLGDLAGGGLGLAVDLLSKLAGFLATVAEKIADVAEAIAKGINWSNLLPDSVTGTWNALADAIGRVKGAINFVVPEAINTRQGKNGTASTAINDNAILPAQAQQNVQVGGTVNVQVTGPATVTGTSSENSNVPVKANTGRMVGRP